MRLSTMLKVSLLAALATVLMHLSLPLIPAFPFLKYDPSEVPALIASFALGPFAGIAVVLLKDLLYLALHLQASELLGIPMNALAGCSLVGTAGWVYQVRKTRRVAQLSLALGVVTMALVMIPANLVLWPVFQRFFLPNTPVAPPDQLLTLILTAVTPFNLLKGTLTSLLTFFLYKRVSPALKSVPRWDVGLTPVKSET